MRTASTRPISTDSEAFRASEKNGTPGFRFFWSPNRLDKGLIPPGRVRGQDKRRIKRGPTRRQPDNNNSNRTDGLGEFHGAPEAHARARGSSV